MQSKGSQFGVIHYSFRTNYLSHKTCKIIVRIEGKKSIMVVKKVAF